MPIKIRCKCGSPDVVYIVQRGRRKHSEAFCGSCMPVESVEDKKDIARLRLEDKKPAAIIKYS